MAGKANTVAIAELGADISDVVAFDLGAAQHAIRCHAGNTAIDKNEAHHVSLPKIEIMPHETIAARRDVSASFC